MVVWVIYVYIWGLSVYVGGWECVGNGCKGLGMGKVVLWIDNDEVISCVGRCWFGLIRWNLVANGFVVYLGFIGKFAGT